MMNWVFFYTSGPVTFWGLAAPCWAKTEMQQHRNKEKSEVALMRDTPTIIINVTKHVLLLCLV